MNANTTFTATSIAAARNACIASAASVGLGHKVRQMLDAWADRMSQPSAVEVQWAASRMAQRMQRIGQTTPRKAPRFLGVMVEACH